jgi:DNA-binding NtrC family response regulator
MRGRALDARVMSTMSRDLEQEMHDYRFLQELYYRMLGEERVAAELGSARMESPSSRSRAGEGLSLKRIARQAFRKTERELILNTLTRIHWNQKRAAQEVQNSYKAFLYKLKQYLDNPDDCNSAVAPG